MKRRIFIPLVAISCLISGLNQSIKHNETLPIYEDNGIIEKTFDEHNLGSTNIRKQAESIEEIDYSRTFVQHGKKANGNDVMRFATALKGKFLTAHYVRSAYGLSNETIRSEVTTVYKGISANDKIYYYNGTDLTTDETYSGVYYWACYTIEFANDTYKDTLFNVHLEIQDLDANVHNSKYKSEFVNNLIAENPIEYSINLSNFDATSNTLGVAINWEDVTKKITSRHNVEIYLEDSDGNKNYTSASNGFTHTLTENEIYYQLSFNEVLRQDTLTKAYVNITDVEGNDYKYTLEFAAGKETSNKVFLAKNFLKNNTDYQNIVSITATCSDTLALNRALDTSSLSLIVTAILKDGSTRTLDSSEYSVTSDSSMVGLNGYVVVSLKENPFIQTKVAYKNITETGNGIILEAEDYTTNKDINHKGTEHWMVQNYDTTRHTDFLVDVGEGDRLTYEVYSAVECDATFTVRGSSNFFDKLANYFPTSLNPTVVSEVMSFTLNDEKIEIPSDLVFPGSTEEENNPNGNRELFIKWANVEIGTIHLNRGINTFVFDFSTRDNYYVNKYGGASGQYDCFFINPTSSNVNLTYTERIEFESFDNDVNNQYTKLVKQNYDLSSNPNGLISKKSNDISSMASGGKYLESIDPREEIGFKVNSSYARKAKLSFSACSNLATKVPSTWIPEAVKDITVNKVVDVYINGEKLSIEDDIIIKGGDLNTIYGENAEPQYAHYIDLAETARPGDGKNRVKFYVWSILRTINLGEIYLEKGDNLIQFKFKDGGDYYHYSEPGGAKIACGQYDYFELTY